jgi:hypothetical protein
MVIEFTLDHWILHPYQNASNVVNLTFIFLKSPKASVLSVRTFRRIYSENVLKEIYNKFHIK